MAEEFKEQPIFNPVAITSESDSFDNFANTLSNLSKTLVNEGIRENQEKSALIYSNAVSEAHSIKHDADIAMIRDPSHSAYIADHMKQSLDKLQATLPLGEVNKAKFKNYTQDISYRSELEAVKQERQQAQIGAQFNWYNSVENKIGAYRDALLSGDEKSATQIQEALLKQNESLVRFGALPMSSHKTLIDTLSKTTQHVNEYIGGVGSVENAHEYHQLTRFPFRNDLSADESTPMDETHTMVWEKIQGDYHFDQAMSLLNDKKIVDYQSFDKMTPHQKHDYEEAWHGIKDFEAIVNSVNPYDHIVDLNTNLTEHSERLSDRQKSLKTQSDMWLQQLKDGNMFVALSETARGKQILNQNMAYRSAANTIPFNSDEERQQYINKSKDNMVASMVSYAKSINIPEDYFNVLSPSQKENMKRLFSADSNPLELINEMNSYSESMKPFVARSVKDIGQFNILQTLVNVPDENLLQDKIDLVAANQTGRNFEDVKLRLAAEYKEKNLYTPSLLSGLLASDAGLQDAELLIFSQYPPETASRITSALYENMTNFIYYQGQKNQDLILKNADKYLRQAKNFVSAAYPVMVGENYIVNKKYSKMLTNKDLSVLADYAIENANRATFPEDKGISLAKVSSISNLKMVITPTGKVNAINQGGASFFEHDLNPGLLSLAYRRYNEKRKMLHKNENLTNVMKAFQHEKSE